MKTYYSSQSLLFVPLLWLIVLGIAASFFAGQSEMGEDIPLAIKIFMGTIGVLLVWILWDTKYQISENNLKYCSGPIRGSIAIREIKKIEQVKTLFVSTLLKPALGSYGLTITHNKFDEIYISPKNKEAFLEELKKINPSIEIIS